MSNSYVQVQGAKELEAKMKALPEKVSKKLAKKALREGCKILQKQAKSNVPVRTGLTKKNIRIKVGKAQKGSVAVMVTIGKKMFQGKAFYAAFQEFGWFTGKRLRGHKTKASYEAASHAAGRKAVAGKHFMEKAYDAKHDEAAQKAEDSLRDQIIKEVLP
jgi:HK97 gp10 family phage protein